MILKTSTSFYLLLLPVFLLAQAPDNIISDWKTNEDRQFDFWIGEWSVNLRVKQKDQSWKDQHQSTARIYPILDGKAILELWNENKVGQGIKGYSLRYFNRDKNKWELWLNWPGKNRSGSSSLAGSFRHGRGEFFSSRKIDDTTELISRYTFCDVSPTSLRWDDAYTKDGGKTWTNNWIMEFSRIQVIPPALEVNTSPLTYDNGKRCDLPEFGTFTKMAGHWKGVLAIKEENGSWKEHDAQLNTHKVLDGCAVFSFIEANQFKSFSLQTFNTFAKMYEETYLDNSKEGIVLLYYGTEQANKSLVLNPRTNGKPLAPGNTKRIWSIQSDKAELSVHQLLENGDWEEIMKGVFQR